MSTTGITESVFALAPGTSTTTGRPKTSSARFDVRSRRSKPSNSQAARIPRIAPISSPSRRRTERCARREGGGFNFSAVPGMAFETTRSPDFGGPCACTLRRLACVRAISLVRTLICWVSSSLENGSVVVVVTPNWPGMVPNGRRNDHHRHGLAGDGSGVSRRRRRRRRRRARALRRVRSSASAPRHRSTASTRRATRRPGCWSRWTCSPECWTSRTGCSSCWSCSTCSTWTGAGGVFVAFDGAGTFAAAFGLVVVVRRGARGACGAGPSCVGCVVVVDVVGLVLCGRFLIAVLQVLDVRLVGGDLALLLSGELEL